MTVSLDEQEDIRRMDRDGATMEEFMGRLDAYLSWYRDGRLKSDLGYMSPAQYRRSLGLAA